MPKCPKCGREIDYLLNYVEETAFYIVSLDDSGELFFDTWDETPEVLSEVYLCPECKEALFEEEDEARAFLRGGE